MVNDVPLPHRRRLRLLLPFLGLLVAGLALWASVFFYQPEQVDGFTPAQPSAVAADLQGPREPWAIDSPQRPATTSEKAWTVLLVGEDSVAEPEALDIPDAEDRQNAARADAIGLAHIDTEDDTTDVVSLPRDLWSPTHKQRLANLYAHEGPSVLAQAVSDLTQVPVDHFASVDMSSFARIVDILGGVPLELENDFRDTQAHITLEAGQKKLSGEQALGYARSRSGEIRDPDTGQWQMLDDQDDLTRIERQHELAHAMFDRASSSDLITTVQLVDLARRYARVDEDLTRRQMLQLSQEMLDSDNLRLGTFPTEPTQHNGTEVLAADPDTWQDKRSDFVSDPASTN